MNKDFNCFFLSGALFLGNIFFACSKEETAKYIPPVTVPVKSNPSWKADARCFLDGETGTFDDMAVKDPSIVYYNGNYHLFYTGRDVGTGGNWRMGYASAVSLEGLNAAKRTYMSSLNGGSYFCAPQVFWFAARYYWPNKATAAYWFRQHKARNSMYLPTFLFVRTGLLSTITLSKHKPFETLP
jgi:hypothetical protein